MSDENDWSGAKVAVVGDGRVGRALVRSMPTFAGPFGRGFDGSGFDVVILAVPDPEIPGAAAAILPGPLVGHCAGSLGTGVLAPHEAFGLHPLMTVTLTTAHFDGASAAVAGTSDRALSFAMWLAAQLHLHPFEIADDDRAAYHAAASIASNFLVTLEDAAEQLLATTGADRSMLLPLVRAAVENWGVLGGRQAITGPIARGDERTVARQRDAVAERCPALLPMFDAMADSTRRLVARDT